jgi:RNA polymerase sigma-70 factor (ECF subfamily)
MTGAELMRLYQKGDIEAFNCLYDRYRSMVYGYLIKRVYNRTDVDEIFQDVFFRLHRSRLRYKSEYPFKPWLFVVLRNSLIDYFRKKGKDYNQVPLDHLGANHSALKHEDRHDMGGLLPENAGLNEKQRKAVELRYGEDFSFDEIAQRLETTSANARQLVSRALRKLRKLIRPGDLG